MCRDIIDSLKTSVIHLLVATFQIKIHNLHSQRIIEESDMWIIKRNVSVFAHPHKDNVRGIITQEFLIIRTNLFRCLILIVDIIYGFERHEIEYMFSEVVAESLRCIRRKANVLVHMVGIDSPPINIFR